MNQFNEIMIGNPGIVIIKMGATWCGPCAQISPYVVEWLARMPEAKTHVIIVDVDRSVEFYSYMKRRKMLHGIPALFCYEKGNMTFVPDHFVIGTSREEIDTFFTNCVNTAEA